MALWTAALLLVLGLIWFVAAVTVSVWQTHKVLVQLITREHALELLGGRKPALRRLRLYAALPVWAAPNRAGALHVLGLCGSEAAPILERALDDPDRDVRWHAAYSLIGIAADTPASVAVTAQALGSKEPERRMLAAGALGRTRSSDETAVTALAAALGDPDERVRVAAAGSLQQLGTRAGPAVPALAIALTCRCPQTRSAAAQALGTMGRAARTAVPALITALREANDDEALRVWSICDHNLGSMEYDARRDIFWALTRLEADLRENVQDVVKVTRSADEIARWQAIIALGRLGPKAGDALSEHGAVSALEEALKDKRSLVRDAAAEALRKIRGEEPPK
jgi:HEAT repeat protein